MDAVLWSRRIALRLSFSLPIGLAGPLVALFVFPLCIRRGRWLSISSQRTGRCVICINSIIHMLIIHHPFIYFSIAVFIHSNLKRPWGSMVCFPCGRPLCAARSFAKLQPANQQCEFRIGSHWVPAAASAPAPASASPDGLLMSECACRA